VARAGTAIATFAVGWWWWVGAEAKAVETGMKGADEREKQQSKVESQRMSSL
jgi:hypothetical protein